MKDFTSIKVDDKLDTHLYGTVMIQDLFVSLRTNKIVYQVYLEDNNMTAICTEDELRQEKI